MKRILLGLVIVIALTTAAVALAATTVTVSADKTKLAFSKKALTADDGKITLRMSNLAVLPHNVALRNGTSAKGAAIAKGKIVGKGGISTITVKLKAGKYRYFCSVPGHEAGGMWGILTVK